MNTRRSLKKDLGHARRIANLERVRAQELGDTLRDLVDALNSADRGRVNAARSQARQVLESDRRRTQGVD